MHQDRQANQQRFRDGRLVELPAHKEVGFRASHASCNRRKERYIGQVHSGEHGHSIAGILLHPSDYSIMHHRERVSIRTHAHPPPPNPGYKYMKAAK